VAAVSSSLRLFSEEDLAEFVAQAFRLVFAGIDPLSVLFDEFDAGDAGSLIRERCFCRFLQNDAPSARASPS
jgi:hypothetical protein